MARIKLSDEALAYLKGTTALQPAPKFIYREKAQPPRFIPSPQQQAIFTWQVDGTGSAFVEAVAGAGKTTTLIEALKRTHGNVFFGAYNTKIAEEIKGKAAKAGLDRQGIKIATLHSAGNSAWYRSEKGRRSKLNKNKVAELIVQELGENHPFAGFIAKMVGFGKQLLMGISHRMGDMQRWREIGAHFGAEDGLPEDISAEGLAQAYQEVVEIFDRSAQRCPIEIDFDDMIFAPLFYNVRFWQNDWVFIDEAQDTNPARRLLARRMLKPNGRLIAVGDPRQAIYGFTGADADSVEQIIRDFKCVRLPLTVTYRCPKAVVAYAQQWVQHIQAHPDAPEGEVRVIEAQAKPEGEEAPKAQPWFIREAVAPADAILCRFTKPLIQTAFAMLRAGIGCKVEGRDIGHGLIKLAQRWKTTKISILSERLAGYREKEVAKAKEKKNESRAQSIEDVCDTLAVFIERCQEKGVHTIEGLVRDIHALFADDVAGVTVLSTGHKAKGREWSRVFWLQKKGNMFNLKDWELVQEDNIRYVISTRSQGFLGIVPEGMQ